MGGIVRSSLVVVLAAVTLGTGIAVAIARSGPHHPRSRAATTATASTTAPMTATTQQTRHCMASPGACGYPDPAYHNVGVPNCASLKAFSPKSLPAADYYYSGSGDVINLSAANVVIQGYDITGWQFIVQNSGDVFNDDCISFNGHAGAFNMVQYGSGNHTSDSHLTVENSDLYAQGCSLTTAASSECMSSGVVQQLAQGGTGSLFNRDIFIGAVEDVGLSSDSTLENSYVVANGYASGAHTEDTYSSPGSTQMVIKHNTLLNPSYETADVFIDNGTGACSGAHNTITGNLMAGGGYMVYACSGATAAFPFTFTDNDIARCETGTKTHDYPGLGGTTCGSAPPSSATHDTAFGAGYDGHGYWPQGGYFGLAANIFCGSQQTWSGNVDDDTGAAVACP